MRYVFRLSQYNQQRQHEKKRWIFPVLLAQYATHLRDNGHDVLWDIPFVDGDAIIRTEQQIDVPFLDLPIADRLLTRAKEKKWQANGNFKYRPGTYIQAASNCWWGKCSFCVEKGCANQIRPVSSVISELYYLKHLGFKEVFDDSGTFPTGEWLKEFLRQKINSSLQDVKFSCNMRFGTGVNYPELKKAGFRMLLYGLESANQKTIDRLNKGFILADAVEELRHASCLGLEPHAAVMFGYPFEALQEELATLELIHSLLKKGWIKTAQASLYCVPGEKAIDRGTVSHIYDVGYSPRFWITKLLDLKNVADFIYLLRSIKKGLLRD